MSFSASISCHIQGEVEAAKALEQEIVDELHEMVNRLRSSGHSVSGQFNGQHTVRALGDAGVHAVSAPAPGMQQAEEPGGAPTGATQAPAQTDPDQPVAITGEGVRTLGQPTDISADETKADAPTPTQPTSD